MKMDEKEKGIRGRREENDGAIKEEGEREKSQPCQPPINNTKSFAVFDTSRRINWKEAAKSIRNAKKVNNTNNNAVIKNPSNSKRTSTSSLNPGKTGVNNRRGENVRTKGCLPLQL